MTPWSAIAGALDMIAVEVIQLARHIQAVSEAVRTARWQGTAAARARTELQRRAAGVRSTGTALSVAADEAARAAAAARAAEHTGPQLLGLAIAPAAALVAHWLDARVADGEADAAQRRSIAVLHAMAQRCRLVASAARQSAAARAPGLGWAAGQDRVNRARLAARLSAWSRTAPGARGARSAAACAAHRVDLRVAAALRVQHVDPVTGRRAPTLLLTYDPAAWAGRGRVAIAFGDPDHAGNVAFVVPGLGSRADPGLSGDADDAWQLYASARRLREHPSTAIVAWLGYQTPDLPEVAFVQRAERGAARLAGTVAALRRSRGEDQPHLTLVGHSYGSVVVALAAQRRPGDVDDLVGVGSPGMTTERATQVAVPAGHLWVGAASADMVTHMSRFGVDPAAQSFGAHRFPAEPPGGPSDEGPHSSYFAPGSTSLAALARIVAGDGASVPWAPLRTDHGYAGTMAPVLLLPPALALTLPLVLRTPLPPTFGDPAATGPARAGPRQARR